LSRSPLNLSTLYPLVLNRRRNSHNAKKRIRFTCATLTLIALSLFTTASAQETVKHRYEVSAAGGSKVATVETSVSKELVSISIIRQDQPTHHYRAYLPIKVTDASIGRQSIFSVSHNDEIIKAGKFNHKFSEVSGPQRSQHAEIRLVRQQLLEDMHILRAVRGFDQDSPVLLAELDYALVTYDNTIFDSTPSALINVVEVNISSAQLR
jgi:hypothetical protein